jgi:uncharacterized protein involved in exopolysaccharide biosynthesis
MSRIDEAWKRNTGATAEPREPATLERFALEDAPRPGQKPRLEEHLEKGKVSTFVAAGPRPVEGKPPASQEAQTSPASIRDGAEPIVDDDSGATLESEKLLDLRQIANYARFVVGSIRRHKILAVGTFSLALALTAGAAFLMPKTYHADAKLLAQRNAVMAALSNPGRAIPWDADAPTRSAAETVLRRDNLIALIRQTNLMTEWERTRAPILKVKDSLMALFGHRPTEEEKLDQIVGLLEAQMKVVAGPVGDGTVTIDLDWPNAQMAYHLVESAQQLFVEARQAAETAAIAESIAILERYAATLHHDISGTLAELQNTQAQRRPAPGTPKAVLPARLPLMPSMAATLPPVPAAAIGLPVLGADLDDPQIPRLKAAVAAKRQEITNLEDTRQRQLSELQARLAQLTTMYTATHPSVVGVQQNIAALSRESPQVAQMKAEAERLETEYQGRVAAAQELLQEEQLRAEMAKRAAVPAAEPPLREARTPPPATTERPNLPVGEPADFASVNLRLELNQLESVLDRTEGARIELAVSQAAFKYRYTVIRPAQIPRAPVRPNMQMVFATGVFGSLLLALAAVVGKDVLSDRIVEQWQVERQLGLPVLGNLRIV